MKKIVLFLFLSIVSCSPKFGTSIINSQQKLNNTDHVLVLQFGDEQKIDGIKVGKISSTDQGFSMNCSYNEIIEPLKELARQNGANIIKIIEHKTSDIWSSCERIKADMYKVKDYKKYEREIEWSKNRKLTWEDFKGTVKPLANENEAALTYCGFSFQSNRVTSFKNAKLFVKNTFYCDSSWVRPNQIGEKYLLEHEQGHFDLTEVYTRILRKKLNEKKLTIANMQEETDFIFNEVSKSYLDKQEEYDTKTEHGLNKKQQGIWNSYIIQQIGLD